MAVWNWQSAGEWAREAFWDDASCGASRVSAGGGASGRRVHTTRLVVHWLTLLTPRERTDSRVTSPLEATAFIVFRCVALRSLFDAAAVSPRTRVTARDPPNKSAYPSGARVLVGWARSRPFPNIRARGRDMRRAPRACRWDRQRRAAPAFAQCASIHVCSAPRDKRCRCVVECVWCPSLGVK